MKRNTILISIVIVLVICIVIGVVMVLRKPPKMIMTAVSEEQETLVEGRELMGIVQSEEEAMKIAEMYGITFVKFADGIAEYTTDKSVEEVIMEGEEKGYPRLSINYIRTPMKLERGN